MTLCRSASLSLSRQIKSYMFFALSRQIVGTGFPYRSSEALFLHLLEVPYARLSLLKFYFIVMCACMHPWRIAHPTPGVMYLSDAPSPSWLPLSLAAPWVWVRHFSIFNSLLANSSNQWLVTGEWADGWGFVSLRLQVDELVHCAGLQFQQVAWRLRSSYWYWEVIAGLDL